MNKNRSKTIIIKNLVPTIKTESDSLSEEINYRNGNKNDLQAAKSKNQHLFKAGREFRKCLKTGVKDSEVKSSLKSGNVAQVHCIAPKEGLENSANFFNQSSNVSDITKHETNILVAPFDLDGKIKEERRELSVQSNSNDSLKFVLPPSAYPTRGTLISAKKEYDAAPILKRVKMEEDVLKSNGLHKGSVPQQDPTFKPSVINRSSGPCGINPCAVVIKPVDNSGTRYIVSSDSLTLDNKSNAIHDRVSSDGRVQDTISYRKAQSNIHDGITCKTHDSIMTHEGTRNISTNVTDSTKRDEISPFLFGCRVKSEGEEVFSSPHFSTEVHSILFHDKVRSKEISDNNIHENNEDRETFLFASFSPDGRIEVKKEALHSLTSPLKVPSNPSCDNGTRDNMISDNNIDDQQAVKRETSCLVAPFQYGIKIKKEPFSNVFDNMSRDNEVYDNIICDNIVPERNPVKLETLPLVVPFLPNDRIKVEIEEEAPSLSSLSKVSGTSFSDNEICGNMICDNNARSKNAPLLETTPLVAPVLPASSTQVKQKEDPPGLSFENEVHDNNANYMICDNDMRENIIRDKIHGENSNVAERETSPLVASYSIDDRTKKTAEDGSQSPFLSREVCHDNKMHGNVIHDDNAAKRETLVVPYSTVSGNEEATGGFPSSSVSSGVCRNSKTHKNMACDIKTHDNDVVRYEKPAINTPLFANSQSKGAKEDCPSLMSSFKVCQDKGTHDIIPDVNHGTTYEMTPNGSAFLCKSCDLHFTRKDYLKRHTKYHCKGGIKNVRIVTSPHPNVDASHGYAGRCLKRNDGLKEKRPRCKDCGKYFSRPDVLKKHTLRMHSRPKDKKAATYKIKCNHCDKSFPTPGLLSSHLSYFQRVAPLKRVCNVCNASFEDSYSFNRHRRWAHAPSSGVKACEGCGKKFAKGLKKHLERPGLALVAEESLNEMTCEFCKKTFSREGFLKCHLLRRLLNQKHVCQLCCAIFEGPEGLKLHMGSVHQKDGTVCQDVLSINAKPNYSIDYTCDHCGKSFKVKGWLQNHIFRRCQFFAGF